MLYYIGRKTKYPKRLLDCTRRTGYHYQLDEAALSLCTTCIDRVAQNTGDERPESRLADYAAMTEGSYYRDAYVVLLNIIQTYLSRSEYAEAGEYLSKLSQLEDERQMRRCRLRFGWNGESENSIAYENPLPIPALGVNSGSFYVISLTEPSNLPSRKRQSRRHVRRRTRRRPLPSGQARRTT